MSLKYMTLYPAPYKSERLSDRYILRTDKLKHRYYQCDRYDDLGSEDAIINKRLYSRSHETYTNLLASALDVHITPEKWNSLWPVNHRDKPCIESPTIVLDLPDIRTDFCNNLMDWSSSNFLTVGFPESVYLWCARDHNNTLQYATVNPSCVKWNPNGEDLFIASKTGTYRLVNVAAEVDYVGLVPRSRCHTRCFVLCSVFHPSRPLMYLGCSQGALSVFHTNKSMSYILSVEDFTSPLTALAISCDGRHIAVSCLSSEVGVYTLDCRLVHFIKMRGPTRAIAWHPWKRSCLIAADCLGFMAMYNVHLSEEPEAFYLSKYNTSIMCISFNPLSAELVASQRIFSYSQSTEDVLPSHGKTQLNVLASFDRVVDRIEGHRGRVPFLSWSPDGTSLATFGTDETAQIWSFLAKGQKTRAMKKKKTLIKLRQSSPSCFALATALGPTIR